MPQEHNKLQCLNQDQFDREANFRISFSIFKQLHSMGLLTAEQLAEAREKLIARFQPPIGRLAAH